MMWSLKRQRTRARKTALWGFPRGYLVRTVTQDRHGRDSRNSPASDASLWSSRSAPVQLGEYGIPSTSVGQGFWPRFIVPNWNRSYCSSSFQLRRLDEISTGSPSRKLV